MMQDHGFYGWGASHAASWVFMILFGVLVIVGVIALVRRLAGSPMASREGQPAQKTALQVPEERYARGELDREEFLERKRGLGG